MSSRAKGSEMMRRFRSLIEQQRHELRNLESMLEALEALPLEVVSQVLGAIEESLPEALTDDDVCVHIERVFPRESKVRASEVKNALARDGVHVTRATIDRLLRADPRFATEARGWWRRSDQLATA